MRKLKLLILAMALCTVGVFAASAPTAHADLFSEACSNNPTAINAPQNSTVCKDKSSTANPLTGSDGVLAKVSSIIAFIAGLVAVIMIIISGGQMIGSGGDANKVKEARTKLVHALIGLAIIAMAQTIILLIINLVLN